MIKIAVIDDQQAARTAVESVVEDVLSDQSLDTEWGVISSAPLDTIEEYADFIESENIAILLVDERLGEAPNNLGSSVDYRGSQLVEELRKNYKQMPMYGITAFPEDETLESHFSQFDEIILRDTFTQKASSYVPRFIRAYQNFIKAKDDSLAELSTISAKIASGEASDIEIKRAAEIQEKINIPSTIKEISSRSEWLTDYEALLDKYENISNIAKQHLGDKDKD